MSGLLYSKYSAEIIGNPYLAEFVVQSIDGASVAELENIKESVS
jgi:hypothetical protein